MAGLTMMRRIQPSNDPENVAANVAEHLQEPVLQHIQRLLLPGKYRRMDNSIRPAYAS